MQLQVVSRPARRPSGAPSDRVGAHRGRRAVLATTFSLAFVGVGALWAGGGNAGLRAAVAAPAPMTREYTIVAQEVDWELMPGTTVKAWTYNGTLPGPELRVVEGDLVRVTLQNQLPVPTTIHWHGVDVPNAMDGVPGLTQEGVPPSGSFTYEFIATNPGTRWYHTHQDPERQEPLGLFGSLIIEPRIPPTGAVSYDRDYTYMLSEWSLALTPEVATGAAALPQVGPGAPHSKELDFDFFLMNGKVHEGIPPVTLRQGERIRIRLINAGALVHTIHTHGHSFKVVALDGNFLTPAQQYVKDAISLGPSERVDLEIQATNPGVWLLHCHMQHHAANGMMTTMQYEGVAAPLSDARVGVTGSLPPPPAVTTPGPAPASQAVGGAGGVQMADNLFRPSQVTVPVGATITWENVGGNLHTASSLDGLFESGSVQPGRAFSHTFTEPGTYRYFCRQHLLSGMLGSVVVQ